MNKPGIGVRISKTFIYVMCMILAILSILPFLIMFVNATRSTPQIQQNSLSFIPGRHTERNYRHMMGHVPIYARDANNAILLDSNNEQIIDSWEIRSGGRLFNPFLGFRNSMIVSLGVVVLAIYFSTLTAYANVAFEWKFKGLLFAFIMFVLMIPTQLNIIGFFQLVHRVNLSNSFIPLILPAIASPGIVFFMRQYMLASLSIELVEAARIDGAKEFYTFNRIILPLMKPALATQAIFVFVGSWNSLFLPMILLRGDRQTMPVMIQHLQGDIYQTVLGAQYMGLALTILPLFIVYFMLSKYIIAGVALGGMKE
ncbi:MAG: carbohydrate ABC transporter permease [Defluviitaleaceae bacterium]|nr:carbohydrate ABC transporter permease [Defluviitaleaceae bacterium]